VWPCWRSRCPPSARRATPSPWARRPRRGSGPRPPARSRSAVSGPDRAAAPTYPPDTLHVGVRLGTEEARTHLRLDLEKVAAASAPTGGLLRLPVADGQDGTRAPEAAELRACLLPHPVDDVDGSFDRPPAPDCAAASTPAVFVPREGGTPPVFTVDLAPFLAAWPSSPSPGALALLPAEGASPSDTWHVAFSQRDRTGDRAEAISATLTLAEDATAPSVEPQPPGPAEQTEALVFSPGIATPEDFEIGAPALPQPAPAFDVPLVPAPGLAAPPGVAAPVAQVAVAGFRYPGVFLLPLLFLAGAAWTGRALTRDLTAPADGSR
jgi:hypothetical protein